MTSQAREIRLRSHLRVKFICPSDTYFEGPWPFSPFRQWAKDMIVLAESTKCHVLPAILLRPTSPGSPSLPTMRSLRAFALISHVLLGRRLDYNVVPFGPTRSLPALETKGTPPKKRATRQGRGGNWRHPPRVRSRRHDNNRSTCARKATCPLPRTLWFRLHVPRAGNLIRAAPHFVHHNV